MPLYIVGYRIEGYRARFFDNFESIWMEFVYGVICSNHPLTAILCQNVDPTGAKTATANRNRPTSHGTSLEPATSGTMNKTLATSIHRRSIIRIDVHCQQTLWTSSLAQVVYKNPRISHFPNQQPRKSKSLAMSHASFWNLPQFLTPIFHISFPPHFLDVRIHVEKKCVFSSHHFSTFIFCDKL